MATSTIAAKDEATFPVDWHSVEVPGTVRLDPMHFPDPLSPMTGSLTTSGFVYGHQKASREFHLGIRLEVAMINHFRFDGVLPEQRTEDETRALGKASEEATGREMGRQLDRWHVEHLPALETLLARLREIDPGGLPAGQQKSLLDEIHRIQSELWTIHFRVAIPMMVSMQVFGEFYSEAIGGTIDDAQSLLVGTNSQSIAAGIGLGDLADSARTLGLERLFQATAVDHLQAALRDTEPGRTFLQQLDRYLEKYGLRSDLFDLAAPTWQENPSIALSTIRSYLETGYDARAAQMKMAGEADAAVERARETLAAYPEAMRMQFEVLLQAGRHGAFLQEEHNFYIDQQGTALTRLALLRFGEDLVSRDLLSAPDDVFMLSFEELREIVGSAITPSLQSQVRNLVTTRQGELEIAWTLEPPPFIGEPPQGPPDESNPGSRAMLSFFGGPPRESDDPAQLLGNPGSRGSITGVARVAQSLDEAKDVRPGEILVARTTMPAWTPLFGVAAAVVTETGGSLSHCAIVAREYGIPAVVGAFGATRRIVSGQEITVDGTRGIVTLR